MQANRNAAGGPAASPTISLTRAHRDALRWFIELDLEGDELKHLVWKCDRERARAMVRRLDLCVRLLDHVGWTEEDERESFEITLDAETRQFIEEIEERARREIVYERQAEEPLRSDPTVQFVIDQDLDALSLAELAREAVA
jgi:hypothetical protein